MAKAFKLTISQDRIATLTFDLPRERANILKAEVLKELDLLLDQIAMQPYQALLIQSAKENIFIAGADINEIKDIVEPEDATNKAKQGQDVFNKLENLPFPTIAVIDGACMGGGTELILACDFRITTDNPKTKIALPEVNLGIIPGFGGTQRMPKVMGLVSSLNFILTGKSLSGLKAYKLGLSDACYPPPYLDFKLPGFIQAAIKNPKALVNKRKMVGPPLWFQKSILGKTLIGNMAKKELMAKTKGKYPAPLAALDVVLKTYGGNLTKGLALEATVFGKLAPGEISKNLIQLFFTGEDLKKDTGVASKVQMKNVKHVSVLGAGVMGGGIAWLFSNIHLPVRMKDIQWDAIQKGFQQAAKVYQKLVKLRKTSYREADLKTKLISGTLDYSGFTQQDLVVEAVVEKIEVKKSVFKELEEHVRPDTIIASNTSSLSITEMAKALKKPGRFIGMHFFNPVNRMPLVEVIPGQKTSPTTIATVVEMSKKAGKTPIVVQNCAGFLVNRILLPYMNEAGFILQEGASAIHVDRLIEDFGMPMGPFTLLDEVGLDVGFHVAEVLENAYGERMQVANILDTLFNEKKLLGKKAGKGIYIHGSKRTLNPEIAEIVRAKGYSRRNLINAEIEDRLMLTMVNEAAKCIEENIVERPEYLDMAMIMGTGFPPFRGGLLRYADARGIENVVDRLKQLNHDLGMRFEPAKKLLELADAQKTFYPKR